MNGSNRNNIILWLSIPLAALMIIISYAGIFLHGTYAGENANWSAQALGQDIFDLFLAAPLLIVTSALAYRNNRTAVLLWGGTQIYLIYTFTIYCFALHFNNFFVLYCFTLGLSFYSFIYFLLKHYKEDAGSWFKEKVPLKTTGILLIIISVMFYFLWLTEIYNAWTNNTVPQSVMETGLLVNPVHALDLSVMLPALFITGILLLKKNSTGLLLAVPMLVFGALMSVTIGLLTIIMNLRGIAQDMSVAVVMGVLTAVYAFLLVRFTSSLTPNR